MPLRAVKENATGTIDGVNRVFEVSREYVPGSLVPYLNGQALPGHVTETGVQTFELEHAPEIGDTVAAYFLGAF